MLKRIVLVLIVHCLSCNKICNFCSNIQGPGAMRALAAADVVLSLDWVDLAGTLRSAGACPKVVAVSLDQQVHNGWSMDYQALPPSDLFLAADTDAVVAALLAHLPAAAARPRQFAGPQ